MATATPVGTCARPPPGASTTASREQVDSRATGPGVGRDGKARVEADQGHVEHPTIVSGNPYHRPMLAWMDPSR